MKTLKALSVTAALTVMAASTIGCTAAQKGAAGGGVVGGVAGAVITQNWTSGITVPAGTAIGAGTGAAVGGLAGDAYASMNQADIERELENMKAELQAREQELAAIRESGLDPDKLAALEAARTELETAKAELEAARAEAQEIARTRTAALTDLNRANDELAATAAKLAVLESELEAQRAAADSDRARMEETISQLRAGIAEREAILAQKANEVEILRTSLDGKKAELDRMTAEMAALNVQLENTSRGVTLTIVDSLLFQPGEAELTAEGTALIGKVVAIIKKEFPGHELIVEGHTDNQPIVRSGWRSNWELGAARALSMVHTLVDQHKIPADKISAVSYGEFRPAASNATPEGRRQNRRAVIVIVPQEVTLERKDLASAR